MTEALWIKRGTALVAADPVTEAMLDEIANGSEVMTGAPRRRRNPKFHRLMMGILQKVLDATQPRFADVDELMFYLKVTSGMFREIAAYGGRVRLVPKSVSFAAMDETAFRRVSDRWLWIIANDDALLPGVDPESLLDAAHREAA